MKTANTYRAQTSEACLLRHPASKQIRPILQIPQSTWGVIDAYEPNTRTCG